jgi:hypothetical protein
MKQIRSLVRGLLITGFTLAIATTLSAQSQDGTIKVVGLKGKARYTTGAGMDWKDIGVGQVLKPGTIIQTASDSYVDLILNNLKASQGMSSAMSSDITEVSNSGGGSGAKAKVTQDAIRVFENTVLSVDKLSITRTGADTITDTQLDLKAGRIFGTVKKLSASSQYEIKIPNGVAGIRGTIYLISADGVLSVLTGDVVVSFMVNGSLITKEVPAGYQFDPTTGQVSPISDPLLQELARLAQLFARYLPNMPAINYTRDNTIYHVSPTQGTPTTTGGGGGGGGD